MAETSRELGRELRKAREEAGLSLSTFAERVRFSKGYLSKVERGQRDVTLGIARAYDRELDAGGALIALVAGRPSRRSKRNAVAMTVGLPPPSPRFVGRARELERIDAFVRGEHDTNACVLSGMAGAGKTALALRGAWNATELFPDGCILVEFGDHSPGVAEVSADDVLDALLRFFGIPARDIPAHRTARAGLYQSRIRRKRLLLVCDDVGTAGQITPLLPAGSGSKLLVTSRNRLNALDDATRLPVEVLPSAEAASLFRAIGGEHARTAADSVVGRVVARCGRLPLALRVAAARFQSSVTWSLDDFDERLADENARLSVLDDGERSVAAAFNLSCQALTGAALRLFGLLALHPARQVEIGSVAALAGTDLVRARRLVDQLSDAHLVTYASADRVTTHDLLRTFARNQVLPCMTEDDRRAATVRLLDHNLLLAAASDAHLDPHRYRTPLALPDPLGAARRFPDHASALAWLHREWPSLVKLCRLAAESGLHEHCWQLASMLRQYFFLTKQWEHWISTQLDAVSAARASGDRQKLAIAVSNLGTAHFDRGDLPVAVDYFQEALGLFRDAEDEHGITTATSHLAWTALYLGEHENALHDLRSVLVSYRRASNTRNAAIALRGIALAETELARYADAVRHAEMARAEFEALDLRLDVAMAVNCTAWAHFHAGNHAEARLRYEEAAALAEKCGSRYETARALTGLGNVHAATGNDAGAAERWAEADATCGPLDPVVVGEARVRAAT